MALEDGHGPLRMLVVIVIDEVFVRHALLLFDVDCRLDDLSEALCVWVAGLEGFGHHVGAEREFKVDG